MAQADSVKKIVTKQCCVFGMFHAVVSCVLLRMLTDCILFFDVLTS